MGRTRTIGKPGMILAAVLLLLSSAQVRACPNCKEAVADGAVEASSLARGYNWSILFMIAVPFTMMTTGALAIREAAKRGELPEF